MRKGMRRRFGFLAGLVAAVVVLPAVPALAVPADQCDYDPATLTATLRVPPAGTDGTVEVAKTGSSIAITFYNSASYECSESPFTIGDGSPFIRTLDIVDEGSGDQSVYIRGGATVANWGANSTSNIARTIDLGDGAGDLVQFWGTDSAETISALAMFPSLTGVEFASYFGFAGNDILTGADSQDAFYGGNGADTMKGNGGNDTFWGGAGNDSSQGNAGLDCAEYRYTAFAEQADVEPPDPSDGNYVEIDSNLTVNLTSGTGSDTGGSVDIGADSYSSVECVYGGAGDDLLIGSAYNDNLYGGKGNDTFRGRGGDDAIRGGTEHGDAGTDRADLSESTYPVTVNLTLGYGFGSTTGIDFISGIEDVTGSAAGDILVGDEGDNVLAGGPGSDTLVGMQGDDTFNGGTGVDTASYDDATYGDPLAGYDVGEVAATAAIDVDLGLSTEQATGGAGGDTFVSPSGVNSVENLTGSSFDDELTGNGAVNILNGVGGEDTVYGAGGNDVIFGGAGDDTLLWGDAGNDTIRGGDGADRINGAAGSDALWGDAGNDVLLGGADGDTLRGGDGDDILVGGSGTNVDVMYGDGGTDTISYDAGTYTIGNSGNAASSAYVVFKLSSVGIQQATNGAGTDVAGDLIENLTGTSGKDTLIGNSLDNTILGLGDNDTIQGGDGNDTLDGGSGSNKIEGQAGTDTCSNTLGSYVFGWPKTCEP